MPFRAVIRLQQERPAGNGVACSIVPYQSLLATMSIECPIGRTFFPIFWPETARSRNIGEYLSVKSQRGRSHRRMRGVIVASMGPRRALTAQSQRLRPRHHGFREMIDRLTVGFVLVCFVWMVVMLFLYEWHSVQSHTR